ncbi:MAG: Gfo/Idh/MocA family oxidoreductase [Verrucomicrobia bacterium]|nr:Gfo/Idh/MocA family oxidoreductase [Verrucomicrobiota bacterium]
MLHPIRSSPALVLEPDDGLAERSRSPAHAPRSPRTGSYRGCRTYAGYRELLAKKDVDAVMIATPGHAHAVTAMAAIKRRKHVCCENRSPDRAPQVSVPAAGSSPS